jgi:beta-N-acetylhexosaminidase
MGQPVDSLTIEQQVGQLFAVGFPEPTPSDEVLDLIKRRHVGSVILFSRNIQSAGQLLALTTTLQQAAREAGHPAPLLIMTDQEGGHVRRLGPDSTIFPGNMALGAAGSEELTWEVARATGRELAAQGINLNLAPVVDINNNPANPVIGVRAFGDEPEQVARLGVAAARGYAAGGVLATLKHFPGHGDTAVDSHRALPVLPFARDRLERIELVPFVRGIGHGAECIMIGHVALPAVMPADMVLPASLSPAIVQGLLRDQLGFAGIAITDCLEMSAVAEGIGVARGAVLALRAGNDLVLVSHRIERQRAALDATMAALASGEIAPERVREAAGRVLALKQRHVSWDRLPTSSALEVVGSPPHRDLAAHAFSASTTIVRDQQAQLPLRLAPEARLLLAVVLPRAVTIASENVFDADALLAGVRRYHPTATLTRVVPGAQEELAGVEATAASADLVVLVTINCHADERQRAAAARIAAAAPRVVGLAACDPYDAGVLPSVGTFLASYEYSAPALAAAVDVLFGRCSAVGRLPVTI